MRDALIIGAGPAGSVAATLLARAGWHVHLLEQHRFPRDKVCGECLSSTGFDVLSRLNLDSTFLDIQPVRLIRTVLHPMDGDCVSIDLPLPMWGISRAALDQFLLQQARDSGAIVTQPARVESLIPAERPRVRWRNLETNETTELEPSVVLLADGKGALLPGRPKPTNDFGIKTHFERLDGPRDAIEMFSVGHNYGGLAPIDGDRTNAAFSVPASLIADAHGDIDRVFHRLSHANPTLRRRLASAKRCGQWLAAPLPRFRVSKSWPAGIIPLGNSAAALEPIGGEGMGLAMRSAELAARFLMEESPDSAILRTNSLRRTLADLWRAPSVACRIASLVVSSRWAANALRSASEAPGSLRTALKLMGKAR